MISRSLILSFIFLVLASVAQAQDLVILHTNDTHSQIEEIRTGGAAGTGGVHLRAGYFAKVRAQYGDDRVLVVDAGDYSQGTPYFTVFRGDLEIELMNALGYEVAALGNHEFDNGVEELARRLSAADFQTVCANYDFSGTPLEPYVKPYVIVCKNGIKTGIFGLLANIKSLVSGQNRAGVVYIDPYEAAQKQADYLKEVEKCDLVIALSHLGYSGWPNQPSDINLARNTRNIDIIIGGHSHTYLKSERTYPDLDGNNVVIVQAGAQGGYVGRFDINFK